jgi:hypothetical protein
LFIKVFDSASLKGEPQAVPHSSHKESAMFLEKYTSPRGGIIGSRPKTGGSSRSGIINCLDGGSGGGSPRKTGGNQRGDTIISPYNK